MSKLLVVEDDKEFRVVIGAYLESRNYEVSHAANGKIACELLANEKFDLIISDIRMPEMSGVDLLKWTQANCPTPFILMTGFSNILQAKEAYELGANEFLSKPFQTSELHQAVAKLLAPKGLNVATEDLDANFVKIPIEQFISNPNIDFDLHIRLSSAKYLKIAHAGSHLPPDQLLYYRDRGLIFLYLKTEDFAKLNAK